MNKKADKYAQDGMIAFDWPAVMIDPHDSILILDVSKNHVFFPSIL
jgi:hypothetical protein